MLTAATRNSMSVTVDYRIDPASPVSQPIQFGVYRSSDSRFDATDSLVGTWTSLASGAGSEVSLQDDSGAASATRPGTHELTIPLPGGLPPDPRKPFVLVVADPGTASATTNPQQTAYFRTYVIGIVTHGALIIQPEARTSVATPDGNDSQAARIRCGYTLQLGQREQRSGACGQARHAPGPHPHDRQPVPRKSTR